MKPIQKKVEPSPRQQTQIQKLPLTVKSKTLKKKQKKNNPTPFDALSLPRAVLRLPLVPGRVRDHATSME
jgi:hypothetical protein